MNGERFTKLFVRISRVITRLYDDHRRDKALAVCILWMWWVDREFRRHA